jgi:hypothetical protein
MQEGIIKITA